MKYTWGKGLKKLIRKSPEINALAGVLAPEIQIVGLVFSNGHSGRFIPIDYEYCGQRDANIADDAIHDLKALKRKSLAVRFDP